MLASNSTYLIGSASGLAAADTGCGLGPLKIMDSNLFDHALKSKAIAYHWQSLHKAPAIKPSPQDFPLFLAQHCEKIALEVLGILQHNHFFTVLGGDHSCAIGTWSGARSKLQGDLGLIWIDAHLDSHTPETSITGNFHGMPLACLLGYGHPLLTNILGNEPKIKPEHLSIIGARSFEPAEEALLKRLNVRIFYMDEIHQRGLEVVMEEALSIAKTGTQAYGISLDIDSIDPLEAPGTGVKEPNGLSAQALCQALHQVIDDKQFIGAEIVEFDPHLDKNQQTEKLVGQLLAAMLAP